MNHQITFAFLLLFISNALSANKEEWKSKAIYQIITDRFALGNGSEPPCDLSSKQINLLLFSKDNQPNYCGGNFQGIINNLDYVQGMGFDAIWISPVVTNTPDQFHGYCAKNWFTINKHWSNDGTTSQAAELLKTLSSTLHSRGMYLMLDVVANHVGPVGTNYTTIVPFNASEYYHAYCTIGSSDFGPNGNPWIVQNCRLGTLPDLDQNNSFVNTTLLTWIHNMITTYSVDGLRIDTVPEVPTWFWTLYTASAGVYEVGEVFDGHIGYVAGFQGPLVALLNYPLYFLLKNVFGYGGSMYDLQTFNNEMNTTFPDHTCLGSFADNHDNPRFLSYQSSVPRLRNYVNYVLTSIGVPIVYYGTEQLFNGKSDPYDREPLWGHFNTSSEMYQFIKTINTCRKKTQYQKYTQIQRYAQSNFYAFSRGTTFMAFTNSDDEITYNITYHPYSNGQKICNIFYPEQDCITIQNNSFEIYLVDGQTKVYVLQEDLEEQQISK